MKWTVRKGAFRFSPNKFRLHTGLTAATWEVVFNETNLYEQLDWENDWNKLIGWSYGLRPRYDHEIYGKGWFPAHHYNSVRIVWRPAKWLKRIELALYVYDREQRRESKKTLFIPINTPVRLSLHISSGICRLTTEVAHDTRPNRIDIPYNIPPSWGYYLNPFFGGTHSSPADMFLHLTRIK